MRKNKKILISIGTIGAMVAPLMTTISCGPLSARDEKGYTFGLALSPVSTFNYIKYESAVQISSSIVEGLTKGAPVSKSAISNYLRLPHVTMGSKTGGLNVDTIGYQSGTLRRVEGLTNSILAMSDKNKSAIYANSFISDDKYVFNLNGKAQWANGDKLTSSNFIDSLVYMLDVNTGSQRLNKILSLDIKNSRLFVEAQNAYAQRFGVTYKNPFGYIKNTLPNDATDSMKKTWSYFKQRPDSFPLQLSSSQAAVERKYVDSIENAARGLGIFGDEFSSHPKMDNSSTYHAFNDLEDYIEPYNGRVITPYKLQIESEAKTDMFAYIVNKIFYNDSYLLPVNKKYIESIGGIEQFGIDANHILIEGPFTIESSVLGINGNIILKKNYDYYFEDEVIPTRVKIFFQEDPVVTGSLFEDGYISEAMIDSVYTKKFFANSELRNLISRAPGFGVTGLVFNLDKETNTNKYLMNPHLRRAILFAIDREELIKISGFDSTFPSYSLLEPTVALESWQAPGSGVSYGSSFSAETMDYGNGFKAPVTPSSSLQSVGLSQVLSNPDQTDRLKNIEMAKREFEIFKRETGQSKITIQFTHDSSPTMLNIALSLNSELKFAFGDAIKLDIKGLPRSIYDTFLSEGKFQLTWRNLDYFTSDHSNSGGAELFMISDGIRKNDLKNIGFNSNPVGSWTLKDAMDYYRSNISNESIADLKRRLSPGINNIDKAWEVIEDLSTKTTIPNISEDQKELLQRMRINAFFNRIPLTKEQLDNINPSIALLHPEWLVVNKDFDTTIEISNLVKLANKIILDQAAIIPTFRVDVTTKINRLPEVSYNVGKGLSFCYIYDLLRKPKPDLPGLEVKGT